MVDLRRAVYSKDFTYENIDGTRETIKLLPLNGSYLAALFKLSKKFSTIKNMEAMSDDDRTSRMLELLDTETVSAVVDVCTATLKRSLPNNNIDDIDDFVSQHLFELFPLVIELNLGNIKAQ